MERPLQITRLPKREFYGSIFEIMKRQNRLPQQIPLTRLTKKVAERIITAATVPIPDCVRCGACCFYGLIPIERREPEPLQRYVEVTADGTDVVIEKALWRDENDGRCVHLSGQLAGEVACGVYEDRPRTCRDFEAGSDRCFGYRRMFGVEPPLGEAEVASALEKLDGVPAPLKIVAVDITIESRAITFDRNAGSDAPVEEELTFRVVAHLSNGGDREIHKYDPAKESWYEHELEGLTLEQAMEKIEQQRL